MTSEDRPSRALEKQDASSAAIVAKLAERTLAERPEQLAVEGPGSARPASPEVGDRYDGPTIRIDSLGLRTVAVDALNEVFPPNVVVVGGSAKQAWDAAENVNSSRAGAVRQVDLGDLEPADLAVIATSLDERDVLVVTSLDRARHDTVSILAGLLELWPSEDATSGLPKPLSRAIDVLVGMGPTARALRLTIPPFFVIVRTWSGKVPEPLREWGAQLVLSLETKVCPRCAEEIRAAAVVCRYCGFEFRSEPTK